MTSETLHGSGNESGETYRYSFKVDLNKAALLARLMPGRNQRREGCVLISQNRAYASIRVQRIKDCVRGELSHKG